MIHNSNFCSLFGNAETGLWLCAFHPDTATDSGLKTRVKTWHVLILGTEGQRKTIHKLFRNSNRPLALNICSGAAKASAADPSPRQRASVPAFYSLGPQGSIYTSFLLSVARFSASDYAFGKGQKQSYCRNTSKKEPYTRIVRGRRNRCPSKPYASLQWQSRLIPSYRELKARSSVQSVFIQQCKLES